jgi:hypothetical protein
MIVKTSVNDDSGRVSEGERLEFGSSGVAFFWVTRHPPQPPILLRAETAMSLNSEIASPPLIQVRTASAARNWHDSRGSRNESKSGRKSILIQLVIVDFTVYMLIPYCACRQQIQLLYSSIPINLMSFRLPGAAERDIWMLTFAPKLR